MSEIERKFIEARKEYEMAKMNLEDVQEKYFTMKKEFKKYKKNSMSLAKIAYHNRKLFEREDQKSFLKLQLIKEDNAAKGNKNDK